MAGVGINPAECRVVFMGSPAFAVPSLLALRNAGFNVVSVVTQPDKPAGRGGRMHAPEVKTAALELGLPVVQPPTLKDPAAVSHLAACEADVFVVAAYGKILPKAVLALPRRGCINVHGSLLPRWRGPSPITAAILAGDSETGVSIMELVFQMDAGPVVSRVPVPITADATTGDLEVALAQLGADELVRVLPHWLAGEAVAVPQDESAVTYCHLLSKEDGHIAGTWDVGFAARAVRAYNPRPGAFVTYKGDRLSIWKARSLPGDSQPGNVAVLEKKPAIGLTGGWLVLDEVQRTGSRRVTGEQFVNGERGQLAPVGLA